MTEAAAKKVAPIAQSGYAFQRLEKMREHKIIDDSFSRLTKIVKVDNYISSSTEKSPPRVVTPTNASVSRPRSACRTAKHKLPITIEPPPKPANGTTYGLGKVLKILCETTK